MSRGALVVAGWAAWVTSLAALLIVWTPTDWAEWVPIAGSAIGAWAIALMLLVRRRPGTHPAAIPAFSPGAVLVAAGLTALVQGTALGVWLVYLGAGIVVVGLGVVVRETVLVRRMRGTA